MLLIQGHKHVNLRDQLKRAVDSCVNPMISGEMLALLGFHPVGCARRGVAR